MIENRLRIFIEQHLATTSHDIRLDTATTNGADTASIRKNQHLRPDLPRCRALPGHDRREDLPPLHRTLMRIRAQDGIQNLLRIAEVPLLLILHLDDLGHHRHRDLLRGLRTDGETDRCIHRIEHLTRDALLCKLLLHDAHPPLRPHQADVGVRFPCDHPQAVLIPAVSPRHDDEVGIPIPRNLLQGLHKLVADHLIGACDSGIVCKHRPVIDAGHTAADHPSDLDDRHRHMPGAQHDELLLVSEQLRVDPLSVDFENPAFSNRCRFCRMLCEKSVRIRHPCDFMIRNQRLFTEALALQQRQNIVFIIRIQPADFLI